MMKAVRVHQFGDPEVMKVENVEKPTPKAGQILIQVKAIGVNPVDTYIRAGLFGPKTFPFTPGNDGAGIVAAVGQGETKFKVGDRVFCSDGAEPLTGLYGEFALVSVRNAWHLPESHTFSEGAALGIPYLTAMRGLIDKAHVKAGETILVHGASGAVGLATCQIAAAWKMDVYGTAGTESGMELAKANGAAKVFNHRDKNYQQEMMKATGGKGFDVIMEMAGDTNLQADIDMVATFGRIVLIGARGETKMNPTALFMKEATIAGVLLLIAPDDEWKKIGEEVVKGLKEGWIKPVIDQEYPLDQAPETHRAVMDHKGGSKGKIILIP